MNFILLCKLYGISSIKKQIIYHIQKKAKHTSLYFHTQKHLINMYMCTLTREDRKSMWEIFSKLRIMTSEQHHWRHLHIFAAHIKRNWKPCFLSLLIFNWCTFSGRVTARWWHQWAKKQVLINQISRNK